MGEAAGSSVSRKKESMDGHGVAKGFGVSTTPQVGSWSTGTEEPSPSRGNMRMGTR